MTLLVGQSLPIQSHFATEQAKVFFQETLQHAP